VHARFGIQLLGKFDGRLPSADVKLVNGREFRGGEASGVDAGCGERISDCLLQSAVPVMLANAIFDFSGHHCLPSRLFVSDLANSVYS
jgi:hypothetical protein